MQIEWVGANRPVCQWSGALRIGAADDNDFVLEGNGVGNHHVVLTLDARGLVLDVVEGASRVYVNARPVRERALLRAGDDLGIGSCRLRLMADTDELHPRIKHVVPADAAMDLRAVAGPLSGRVFSVRDSLQLGTDGSVIEAATPTGVTVRRREGQLMLDASLVDEGQLPSLNGRPVRKAGLFDGDQLMLGTYRFIVDIGGQETVVLPDEPEEESGDAESPRRSHPEIWLVATAAVLAVVLAAVLLLHP